MSDLHERFETLARRGTPRGGDEVLAAARALVDDGDTALHATPDSVTAIGMRPDRTRRPRRHFSSLVAAAGVAATLFVGTLAFSAFLGAGSGSDSPEGAVRQLADAVSHEDPVAAADVLVPEEVQSLSQTVDAASRRAQELELARNAAAPFSGLDLSVDGLDLTTETLADGYAKVTVSGGELSADTQTDQLSPVVQRAFRDSGDSSAQVDLASLAGSLDLPTFVVAIERGGNWYVSAAYTTLEYIRVANQLPAADFGSGLRASATLGAASPDAAVTEAMRALAGNDWQKLISLAPPSEIPAYDYRAALTQLGQDEETDFTIGRLETASTVSGDTATVSLRASGTTDSGEWSIDGGCFKPPASSSEGSVGLVGGGEWCSVPPFFTALPYVGVQPDATSAAAITVVRRDGRWFVSPVGTVLDLVDQWVSQVTRRQLYSSIGVPELLPSDGTLTLGRPVTPGDPADGASVYSFDGRRGERLLGLVTAPPGYEESSPTVLVYGPDGTVLRDSYDLIDGTGLQLRADGAYKVVVQVYAAGQTFTIWDEARAPETAKRPPGLGGYDVCEPTPGGGSACSSSSGSEGITTPTTVPGG